MPREAAARNGRPGGRGRRSRRAVPVEAGWVHDRAGRAPRAARGGTRMMMEHRWTALVTILALLVYFAMGLQVGRARGKCGIEPPAMTGDALLERANRVQINTLEWLPLFLA